VVIVFGVIFSYEIDCARAARWSAGIAATSTLATAVQCSGARRPIREYIRTLWWLSYLSM
jgi:hypothetical protein